MRFPNEIEDKKHYLIKRFSIIGSTQVKNRILIFFHHQSNTAILPPLFKSSDSSNQFAFFKVVRKIGIPLYIIFTLRTLKIYERILLFFEYLNMLDPLVCQNLRHFVFLASDGKEGKESITRSHHINSTLREEALRSSQIGRKDRRASAHRVYNQKFPE